MATRVSYPVEVKRKAIEMKLTGIPVSEVNSNDCSGVDGVHSRGSQCNPSKCMDRASSCHLLSLERRLREQIQITW